MTWIIWGLIWEKATWLLDCLGDYYDKPLYKGLTSIMGCQKGVLHCSLLVIGGSRGSDPTEFPTPKGIPVIPGCRWNLYFQVSEKPHYFRFRIEGDFHPHPIRKRGMV